MRLVTVSSAGASMSNSEPPSGISVPGVRGGAGRGGGGLGLRLLGWSSVSPRPRPRARRRCRRRPGCGRRRRPVSSRGGFGGCGGDGFLGGGLDVEEGAALGDLGARGRGGAGGGGAASAFGSSVWSSASGSTSVSASSWLRSTSSPVSSAFGSVASSVVVVAADVEQRPAAEALVGGRLRLRFASGSASGSLGASGSAVASVSSDPESSPTSNSDPPAGVGLRLGLAAPPRLGSGVAGPGVVAEVEQRAAAGRLGRGTDVLGVGDGLVGLGGVARLGLGLGLLALDGGGRRTTAPAAPAPALASLEAAQPSSRPAWSRP